MKDAVNAAAGGDGIPTRRIAGDAGREYILQTEEDTKAKAAHEAGTFCHVCVVLHLGGLFCEHQPFVSVCGALLLAAFVEELF